MTQKVFIQKFDDYTDCQECHNSYLTVIASAHIVMNVMDVSAPYLMLQLEVKNLKRN